MSKEELDFYNNLQRVAHEDDDEYDDEMYNAGAVEAVIDQMQQQMEDYDFDDMD